jgi:hypothetical protein
MQATGTITSTNEAIATASQLYASNKDAFEAAVKSDAGLSQHGFAGLSIVAGDTVNTAASVGVASAVAGLFLLL